MNIIKQLIRHQWKESARSQRLAESIGVKIIYWFFISIMLLYVLLAGIFIDVILEKSFPQQDPIALFNGIIIYYLGMDLMMRFFLQDLPVLSIIPYLHLPIKKHKMIHFMLSKSLLSLFNYLPLFIFIPFYLKAIGPAYGWLHGSYWLIGIILLMITNNFLAIYIKRQLVNNGKIVFGFLFIIIAAGVANYFQIINIDTFSNSLLVNITTNPVYLIFILTGLLLFYFMNFNMLINNAYIEEIDHSKPKSDFKEINYGFLQKLGQIGQLILVEIRLILRNKRPKSILLICTFFMFYGLIFYPQEIYRNGFGWLIFVGLFMTGIFLTNYGQLLISWNSNFFDKIISTNISVRTYFESKFWLFVVSSTAAFILSIPYVFFGWKILIINFACYLFNIGVNSFLILYFSMKNPKRIDLSKKATFNYEGITATQFIMMIPVFIVPIVFVTILSFLNLGYWAVAFLGICGLVSLMLKDFWFTKIEQRFAIKKHAISEGLRKE